MQNRVLTVFAFGSLVFSAACSHKAPVQAGKPEAPAPAATPAPAPPAQVARTTPAPAPQRAETPRSATMPAETRALLNDRLARLSDALFDYDKATIRSDATVALKDDVAVIRGILGDYPSQKLLIEGHADNRGSEEYNMALGDKRARAAEEFLTSMGITGSQLTVISYGKDRPVCTDETEACWQRNRRAHITAAP